MSTIQKQNIMKPGKITMDKLGEMINNGFKEANQNLRYEIGRVDERIDGLDKKFDQKFDDLDKKFDGLDKKVDDLDKKIDFRFNGLQKQDG